MNEAGNRESTTARSDTRFMVIAACAIIVIAGLKAAASLVIPILTAALLGLVCVPPMNLLRRLKVPDTVAAFMVVAGMMAAFGLLSAIVGNSIGEFTGSIDKYETRLNEIKADWFTPVKEWYEELEQKWSETETESTPAERGKGDGFQFFDADKLLNLVAQTTGGVLDALSNIFIVLLVLVFLLLEVNDFPDKLRHAVGKHDADLSDYSKIAQQIYGYMSIKFVMSFFTGICAWGLTAAFGVDFPELWGLMAFLFNFVPNVGSIIAAIPAVLLALIQFGLGTAALIAGGYALINILIGNMIEPRVMGKRLGLSPLVVVLSLIFWAWVWGPVGMVLSLPLTMVAKIVFEQSEELRFVGVLLGPAVERKR